MTITNHFSDIGKKVSIIIKIFFKNARVITLSVVERLFSFNYYFISSICPRCGETDHHTLDDVVTH